MVTSVYIRSASVNETYLKILNDLLSYWQVRLAVVVLEYIMLLAATIIAAIIVLHMVFIAGYRSPLYRRRSPRPRWTGQLMAGGAVIIGVLLGLTYLTDQYLKATL